MKIIQGCGHIIASPSPKQEKARKYLESCLCYACKAGEKAKDYKWPILTGSERQVAWAENIRQQYAKKAGWNDIQLYKRTDAEDWIIWHHEGEFPQD